MNFNKCRICLKEKENSLNIFIQSKSGMIYTKLVSVTKVQIHPNDGLPKFICRSCNKRLDICVDFINLCEKSERTLKCLFVKDIASKDELKNISSDNKSIQNISPNAKNELSDEIVLKKKKVDIANDISKRNNDKQVSHKKQCFKCGKIVSSSFRLKTHLATHSREKPYECQYCKKKFSLLQNLNVHLRIHTGEKPFHCSICGVTFTQSSGLTAHKRKHTGQTPYKCVLCPRSFRTVGHLQYHTRRHTGEKNYECNTCHKAFITRSDLKQHQITHSGEKLHVCSTCGCRFSRASNLKRHTMFSHSDKIEKNGTMYSDQSKNNLIVPNEKVS